MSFLWAYFFISLPAVKALMMSRYFNDTHKLINSHRRSTMNDARIPLQIYSSCGLDFKCEKIQSIRTNQLEKKAKNVLIKIRYSMT